MVFYGASGHAKVVIESWAAVGGKVTAIFDDNEKIKSLLNLPVSGKFDNAGFPDEEHFITIGFNEIRKKVVDRIKVRYGKVIHLRACLSPSSVINEGTVVMANVVINADTIIGKHSIINTSSSIDHDCIIGDFVHIAPGATLCGGVQVGEGTLIGAGAVILPGIKIGSWSTIGAGSVVTKDVADSTVVGGNPARNIKF